MEQGFSKYLLNGNVILPPLSSFLRKAPTLCRVGGSRHSVQLRLSGAHLGWNSRSNYRQISIITTHINQRPSPQLRSPGNRNCLRKALSCLSPSVFLVPRECARLRGFPAMTICKRDCRTYRRYSLRLQAPGGRQTRTQLPSVTVSPCKLSPGVSRL